jgi:hypothetical protein
MKKLSPHVSLVFILLFFSITRTIAQAPETINYQSVVRNITGDIVTNQAVAFKLSILQESASGTSVYEETHTVTTNQYGLVDLKIGAGTVLLGSFSAINWGANAHFLETSLDINGGNNYQLIGTSELLSVPYALHATTAGTDNDWTISGNNLTSAVSGNIGIGTTNPVNKLDVNGVIRAVPSGAPSGSSVSLTSPSGHPGIVVIRGDGSGSQSERWNLRVDSDDVFRIASDVNDKHLSIRNNGNIGINADTPTQKLHVNGNIRMVEGNQSHGKVAMSLSDGTMRWIDPANLRPHLNYATYEHTPVVIPSTAAPTYGQITQITIPMRPNTSYLVTTSMGCRFVGGSGNDDVAMKFVTSGLSCGFLPGTSTGTGNIESIDDHRSDFGLYSFHEVITTENNCPDYQTRLRISLNTDDTFEIRNLKITVLRLN